MKFYFVLLMILFLSACGGGGGATSGNSGATSGKSVGDLTIHIQSAEAPIQQNAKVAALASVPQSTYVRVVLSNQNVKYNNQTFKQIQDIPVGTVSSFAAVPAAYGYNVEVISYIQDGGVNRLLKYAKNSVDVTANATNTVTLTMAPIQVTLKAPISINSGASYNVSTTFSSPTPLQTSSYLSAQLSDITTPLHTSGSFSSIHNQVAPTPFVSGTLYFQGEFFINANLLNYGESYQAWTFNSPNPLWGDLPVSSSLIVPTGGITISVPPVI